MLRVVVLLCLPWEADRYALKHTAFLKYKRDEIESSDTQKKKKLKMQMNRKARKDRAFKMLEWRQR